MNKILYFEQYCAYGRIVDHTIRIVSYNTELGLQQSPRAHRSSNFNKFHTILQALGAV